MDYRKWISIAAALLLVTGIGILVVLLHMQTMEEQPAEAVADSIQESVSAEIPRLSEIADLKKQPEKSKKEEISILLSSISKDIKVKMIDSDGHLVQGIPWKAYIRDASVQEQVYEDTDQDGIIYIPEVKSGAYEVMLADVPEFQVPHKPARVEVKDEIKYQVVADIRDEIKMESEVNAVIEDTADIEEVDEGITHAVGQVGTLGIDVSKWNKEIDWNRVKNAGVDYAIIRLGYRGSSTGALVEDPYFAQNLIGARQAGVKVGVYFFTQALTEPEAVEEASMVAAVLAGSKLDYPVFLDVEGSGGRADNLPLEQRTQAIRAFCETIESVGYQAGVYANKNWFTNKIQTEQLSGYTIWLAQYNVTEPTYEGNYHIWQYSSKGNIDGISGFVDMNQSYIE